MSEWIKFDKATPDKPEVHEIAAALALDPDAVVGKALRVWSWFDTHTEDGNAPVTVCALLDRLTGVTGFVAAMQNAGWIHEAGGFLCLPHFDRHLGKTAKTRALTAQRVAKSRNVTHAPLQETHHTVTSSVTESLPEKKRKEEKRKEEEERREDSSFAPGALPEEVVVSIGNIRRAYPKTQRATDADRAILLAIQQGCDPAEILSRTQAIAEVIASDYTEADRLRIPSAGIFFEERRWLEDAKDWRQAKAVLREQAKAGAASNLDDWGNRPSRVEATTHN